MMTDQYKERIEKRLLENPVLRELFSDVFGGPRNDATLLALPDGTAIIWHLKADQGAYRYWKKGKRLFCYSPWKDTENWYWSWEWRIGEEYPRKLQKHRKRKDAKKRAHKLYGGSK